MSGPTFQAFLKAYSGPSELDVFIQVTFVGWIHSSHSNYKSAIKKLTCCKWFGREWSCRLQAWGEEGKGFFSGPHAQFLPHMPSFRYSWPASQLNPLFSLGLSPQLLDRLSVKQETKMKTIFIVPLWFDGTFQGKLFIHDSKSLISWWVVWKQTALSGWSYVCSSSLLCLSKYHVWLSIIIIMQYGRKVI